MEIIFSKKKEFPEWFRELYKNIKLPEITFYFNGEQEMIYPSPLSNETQNNLGFLYNYSSGVKYKKPEFETLKKYGIKLKLGKRSYPPKEGVYKINPEKLFIAGYHIGFVSGEVSPVEKQTITKIEKIGSSRPATITYIEKYEGIGGVDDERFYFYKKLKKHEIYGKFREKIPTDVFEEYHAYEKRRVRRKKAWYRWAINFKPKCDGKTYYGFEKRLKHGYLFYKKLDRVYIDIENKKIPTDDKIFIKLTKKYEEGRIYLNDEDFKIVNRLGIFGGKEKEELITLPFKIIKKERVQETRKKDYFVEGGSDGWRPKGGHWYSENVFFDGYDIEGIVYGLDKLKQEYEELGVSTYTSGCYINVSEVCFREKTEDGGVLVKGFFWK